VHRSLLVSLGIVSILLAVSAHAAFSDTQGHPFASQVETLRVKGLVRGYSSSVFGPDRQINRAEFLKILTLAAFGDAALETDNVRCFADFVGPEQWYWVTACAAKEKGILTGYPDGTFRGETKVNLVEAIAMTARAWQLPLPVYIRAPDHWYEPYVIVAAERGLFAFLPQYYGHILTRAEAAVLLVEMNVPLQTIESTEPAGPGVCGNEIVEGDEQCDDGNLRDGDGCSKICISVPEPVRHGALKIEQQSSGSGSFTEGGKNIPLLRFAAVAGRQDVRLSGVLFTALQGNLLRGTRYRLLYDANGDEVPEKLAGNGTIDGSLLTFSALNVEIPDGHLVLFEIVADVGVSATGTLRIGFATDHSRYVEAVGVEDGRDLGGIETNAGGCTGPSICWISVTTTAGSTVDIEGEGTLYITESNTPMKSRLLLLGKESVPLLGFEVRAEKEDIALTAVNVGGGAGSIRILRLFEEGSSVVLAELTPLSCVVEAAGKFCARSAGGIVTIPRGSEKKFLLRALLKGDTEGGVSGETVALTISANTTTDIAFEARGLGSSRDLPQNDNDAIEDGEIILGRDTAGANIAIVGETNQVVGAKIESISNANADPDNTSISGGTQAFGQFRFRAMANQNSKNGLNDVTLTDLVFSVSAVNVTLSDFKIYNKLEPSVKLSCTGNGTTGSITVTCSNLEDSAVSTVIEQGAFIDLALEASVTLSSGAGSQSLQASLNQLGDRGNPGTIEWEDDVFPFDWVDLDVTQVKSTLYRNP